MRRGSRTPLLEVVPVFAIDRGWGARRVDGESGERRGRGGIYRCEGEASGQSAVARHGKYGRREE